MGVGEAGLDSPVSPQRRLTQTGKMTKLEEYLEGIINIFHQYSVRVGDFDTLSKGELKQLITKELANSIKVGPRSRGLARSGGNGGTRAVPLLVQHPRLFSSCGWAGPTPPLSLRMRPVTWGWSCFRPQPAAETGRAGKGQVTCYRARPGQGEGTPQLLLSVFHSDALDSSVFLGLPPLSPEGRGAWRRGGESLSSLSLLSPPLEHQRSTHH